MPALCLARPQRLFSWLQALPGRALSLFSAPPQPQAACGRAARDRQAERLLDAYGNSILRLAYSYLHDLQDAEDILQDTLLQYLKAAPVLESPAHEKAWLLRVAANLSKNRIAYNKRRQADPLQEELVAEQQQDLAFVWEAMKALPVKYREVLHLFYHEGYPAVQIAALLGRNEATVRSQLLRGRGLLKQILQEEYGLEATV